GRGPQAPACLTQFDREIAALDIARCRENPEKAGAAVVSADGKDADHRQFRLLCPRAERRGNRAAKRCNELAPFHCHSITSSARPRSVIGKVSPSVLAVFMLMISSTRVACCTGRSEGFSPLRMRLAYTPPRRYASLILPP